MITAARSEADKETGHRRLSRHRVTSLLLVAPLLIFTIVVFLLPIVTILTNAVASPEVSRGLPRTSLALAGWHPADRNLPGGEVFDALAQDLAEKSPERTRAVAAAARRLNYEVGGFRSLIVSTERAVKKSADDAGNWRERLIGMDGRWGDIETWQALRRAAPAHTPFYILSALDMRQAADGSIGMVPENQRTYVAVLMRTLKVAAVTTLICLALGYPFAALMVKSGRTFAFMLLGAVMLPFWTSLLAKTSSWIVILQEQGPLNKLLSWSGIVSSPLQLIFNATGLYIVMAHMMLPFMVLPLYSTMKGIPSHYMKASSSLGANPARGFFHVYLPMSLPGVGAGALLTFIVSAGYYITPSLVGSPREQMLGYFVAFYAYTSVNWGLASALGLMLLVCVLALYLLAGRTVGVRQIAGLR
jgi:putative spermidine/putrescine transport system permease protein